jgi:hypothetical protein
MRSPGAIQACAVALTCSSLAGCASESPVISPAQLSPPASPPTTDVPTARGPAPTAAPTAGAATKKAPPFPPQAPLVHQGTAWAVVVAISRTQNDPKLAAAVRSVTAVGYRDVVVNPVSGCDQGMREGLKLNPGDYWHVSLYFADAATAQQFVDAYQPGVVGTVKVVTGCAD